jgi:hypothetical protein
VADGTGLPVVAVMLVGAAASVVSAIVAARAA